MREVGFDDKYWMIAGCVQECGVGGWRLCTCLQLRLYKMLSVMWVVGSWRDVECDVHFSATQDRTGQENLVAGISPRHREMDPGEETVIFVTVPPLSVISLLFLFQLLFMSLFLHSL